MMSSKDLLQQLTNEHNISKSAEQSYTNQITTGIVVDTDDPLQMGRLRIFCPNLNDNPKKLHHLPWAVYVPPFAGTINNSQYARGTGKYPESTEGAVSYGFWGIPEQGAKAIVACLDGDERRRIWLGCLHEHQESHTLLYGRYKWNDGEIDGPLSSSGSAIEPQYTNAGTAFQGDRKSREWKTRQAEYQITAIHPNEDDPNSDKQNYTDQLYPEMEEAEKDKWVKPIVGAHGYDWSGNKAVGAHLASRVYGFSTPGGHFISLDDRPYNSRIKIKSQTGHQIILDDTNERIYMSTNEGANWIELDSSGNIDIYAKRRVSVHSEKDINFSTDESFRVKAKKGIYMYSGDTTGQDTLAEEKPEDGEIRFHSTGDTHLMVEKNLRMLVEEDWLSEIGGKHCLSIAENMLLQVEEGIDTIVNDGDYQLSVDGNYHHNVSGDTSIFSGNDNILQAVNDTKVFSYTGKMDIGALQNMSIKTYKGNMTLEALSPKSSLKLLSNAGANQFTMGNPSFSIFTLGEFAMRSAKSINQQINKDFGVGSDNEPTYQGAPLDGCLRFDGGVNVSFNTSAINLDAVDDIYNKVQNGIDGLTDPVDTTVGNINKSLNQIQNKVNDLTNTMHYNWSRLNSVWGDWNPLELVLPALPTFPSPPSLTFPAINLPELPFDFCIEVGPLISVERFDIIPHNMFGTFDMDLGLLSKTDISNWVNRHKNKLSSSVDSLQNAKNTALSFDTAINNIQANVNSMKDALNNLVDVNITIGNDVLLSSYIGGVNGFKDSVSSFNAEVYSYNNSVGSGSAQLQDIIELENALDSHASAMNTIQKNMDADPSEVISEDYTDLNDIAVIVEDYSIELGGIT